MPIEKADDVFQAPKPVTFGHFGGGSFHTTFLSILIRSMDSNAKLIGGYNGASEVIPAIERDEVDGSGLSWSSARSHVDRGVLKVVTRAGAYAEQLKDVPLAKELAPTDNGKRMLSVLNGVLEARRIFVLPPGTPEDTVEVFSNAFMKAMKDPELLEQLAKAKRTSDHIDGAKAKQIMMDAIDQPEAVVQAFKDIRKKS
jgi:tripartite-type tricarboxylate transporter receptor subunit TctC